MKTPIVISKRYLYTTASSRVSITVSELDYYSWPVLLKILPKSTLWVTSFSEYRSLFTMFYTFFAWLWQVLPPSQTVKLPRGYLTRRINWMPKLLNNLSPSWLHTPANSRKFQQGHRNWARSEYKFGVQLSFPNIRGRSSDGRALA